MKARHLTLDEKRDWLAVIFRDESGEFSQAEKFKAMVEDTRLAQLAEAGTQQTEPREQPEGLLHMLPPPLSGS